MARAKRPTGDAATNARKRFYRSAERYLKQAAQSAGATASRYRELARLNLEDALKTYSASTTQKFSKPIQRIANELGIDLEAKRQKMKERAPETAEKIRESAIDLGGRSQRALAGTKAKNEQLRQDEARSILNSPIGSRIIGGTVEIWQEAATITTETGETQIDKTKILPSLYEYFGVDNLADLLSAVEEITGETLYSHGTVDEMYETVKLMLQKHVSSNVAA